MRSFCDVDPYDPDEDPGAVEAAEFYGMVDNEGGITGLIAHSGAAHFPEALRVYAHEAEDAIELLRTRAREWAAERGVKY